MGGRSGPSWLGAVMTRLLWPLVCRSYMDECLAVHRVLKLDPALSCLSGFLEPLGGLMGSGIQDHIPQCGTEEEPALSLRFLGGPQRLFGVQVMPGLWSTACHLRISFSYSLELGK